MILSGQSIRERMLVNPCVERSKAHGMTYGLGPAGYDIRIDKTVILRPGDFALAATIEHFALDADVLAVVHDKSTWARKGLSVFNTIAEPGWRGWLTLELKNQGHDNLTIEAGCPIAQMIFHLLDRVAEKPYSGRYQDAPQGATPAKLLEENEPV